MSKVGLLHRMLANAVYETRHGVEDGTLYIERTQNVDAIVAANALKQEDAAMTWGDGQLVASVPFIIYEKWKNEEGFDMLNCTEEELVKKLNLPENKVWRTRLGRI